MGHEISTTALQLAQACSVIANGGMLVRPRLILKRQRPGEKARMEPAEAPHRILKPETAITMRQLMEGVVVLPYGTGKAARLPGYTSGGKTGSAQIFDPATKHYTHFYNGSFVGFTPVTNPAIVIAVTLNGTKLFGGVVAAPVFKKVALDTLRLLEVPRDLPETAPEPEVTPAETNDLAIADLSEPPEDLAAPPAEAAPPDASAPQEEAVVVVDGPRVPSFQGKTVRAVVEESLAAGVPVDVIGSGVARIQAPAPGAFLHPGERVRVQFQ
jgi:membrane peptidoglycan carboxypeptidase